ncbi:MAG: hypothetical protein JNJ57_21240 [Saprospiraceae bacterium]|nr:hypothetical protein [Saprospiraceae bacterium]
MKNVFAYLLLLVMLFNVAAPLALHLCEKNAFELTEWGADDSDEEGKKETEKENFAETNHFSSFLTTNWLLFRAQDNCFNGASYISQHTARMLEIPPEA